MSLSLIFGALVLVVSCDSASLGDGLWRTYTKFVKLPQNSEEAIQDGWISQGECQPSLGVMWSQQEGGPTKDAPVSIYLTPYGQLAGVAVTAYGDLKGSVVEEGFWQRQLDGSYFISATFRDADDVCSRTVLDEELGDRVVINAAGVAKSLPMTLDGAVAENYETGACFASMGTHSFLDLQGNGTLTWTADSMMPVVPMYDRNNAWALNAIFFTTPVVQQKWMGIGGGHQWEPIPLPNMLMCKNFCDERCCWSDANLWSTIHFYFKDPNTITCLNNCKVGCCEK